MVSINAIVICGIAYSFLLALNAYLISTRHVAYSITSPADRSFQNKHYLDKT